MNQARDQCPDKDVSYLTMLPIPWYKLRSLSPQYNIRILTCHPTPRLIIDGGIIVALAYLEAPMKAPVDYKIKTYQIHILVINRYHIY